MVALAPNPFVVALAPNPFALAPNPFALAPNPFALAPDPFALSLSKGVPRTDRVVPPPPTAGLRR